jgi:Pentapeptide repeats (8 copies)
LAAQAAQAWLTVGGAFLAAVIGVFKYFNYRSKRDRIAVVGASFSATVEALASDNETRRMAAAVLLRRFFDRKTEQGTAGTPYLSETVEVIAGLLREAHPERLQKVLADGLRNAYLGMKKGDKKSLNLSQADLFEADCSGASLRGVTAVGAVFHRCTLVRTVLTDANLEGADFRAARLTRAQFTGAHIGGARFEGAEDIPTEVALLLDGDLVAPVGATVAEPNLS